MIEFGHSLSPERKVESMEVGDRIRELRIKKDMSQEDLAKAVGFTSKTSIAKIESNDRGVRMDYLVKIAQVLGTTPTYLLVGYKDEQLKREPAVRIRVVGDVAAGIPIEEIDDNEWEDPDSWEEIPQSMARHGDYFGLRLKGDSMSPRMNEGDVVIVKKQTYADDGDIIIAQVNGDKATCKKIRKSEEGITLVGLNPQFEPIFYTWRQVAELPLSIIGKVVELRAKF